MTRRRSSLAVVIALVLVSGMLRPARAQQTDDPYTLSQVRELLEGGVAPARVLALVERSCRSFLLTADVEEALAEAGATAELIDGLEDTCTAGIGSLPNPVSAPEQDTMQRMPPGEDERGRIMEDSAQAFVTAGYVRGRASGAFYGPAGETATAESGNGARLAVTGRGSGWGFGIGLDLFRYPSVESVSGATDEVGLFLRIERHLAPRASVHPFVAAQARLGQITFDNRSTADATSTFGPDSNSIRVWGLAGGAGLMVNLSNAVRLQLGGEFGRIQLSGDTRNIDPPVAAENWTQVRGVAGVRFKI